MFKKLTIDFLVRLIRALGDNETFEFSTAAYDGGLNYTVLNLNILGEDYIAVVAPQVSEKAFLIYRSDVTNMFWEDDFKFFLETLDVEIGLDPDGYPFVKSDELERYLVLHPDIKYSEDDVWEYKEDEDEETATRKSGCLLDKYYQPYGTAEEDLPEDLPSFAVFSTESDCRRWLEDNGYNPDDYDIEAMSPGTIQGPALMYRDCGEWFGVRLLAVKLCSGNEFKTVLFPDDEDVVDVVKEEFIGSAIAELSAFSDEIGKFESVKYVPEDDLKESDLRKIEKYFVYEDYLSSED